jgi:hypothetical protein
MSRFLGKVFGAVGAFSSRKLSFNSRPQDQQSSQQSSQQPDNMAIDEAAPAKNPMKRLFEEDDDDEDGANAFGSGPIGKTSSFTINEEYARRYEHNKKREEKQKRE